MLDLGNGELVMHRPPDVNKCSQGAIHGHAEYVTLLTNDNFTATAIDCSELEDIERMHNTHGDSGTISTSHLSHSVILTSLNIVNPLTRRNVGELIESSSSFLVISVGNLMASQ